MTLVAALQAKDSIVFAGDNRGTFGDPRGFMAVSDMRRKVFRLGKYCGIGVSGPPDLASALLAEVQRELAERGLSHMDDVLPFTRERLRTLYNDAFRDLPADRRPLIGFIVAGYEKDGTARVYSLSSEFGYAPMLSEPGFCILGLPLFPTYLVNRFYDREASGEQVAALAEFLISETGTQDPKVGGPVTMALILPEQGFKELEANEIAAIHSMNEQQMLRLKQYFSKGTV